MAALGGVTTVCEWPYRCWPTVDDSRAYALKAGQLGHSRPFVDVCMLGAPRNESEILPMRNSGAVGVSHVVAPENSEDPKAAGIDATAVKAAANAGMTLFATSSRIGESLGSLMRSDSGKESGLPAVTSKAFQGSRNKAQRKNQVSSTLDVLRRTIGAKARPFPSSPMVRFFRLFVCAQLGVQDWCPFAPPALTPPPLPPAQAAYDATRMLGTTKNLTLSEPPPPSRVINFKGKQGVGLVTDPRMERALSPVTTVSPTGLQSPSSIRSPSSGGSGADADTPRSSARALAAAERMFAAVSGHVTSPTALGEVRPPNSGFLSTLGGTKPRGFAQRGPSQNPISPVAAMAANATAALEAKAKVDSVNAAAAQKKKDEALASKLAKPAPAPAPPSVEAIPSLSSLRARTLSGSSEAGKSDSESYSRARKVSDPLLPRFERRGSDGAVLSSNEEEPPPPPGGGGGGGFGEAGEKRPAPVRGLKGETRTESTKSLGTDASTSPTIGRGLEGKEPVTKMWAMGRRSSSDRNLGVILSDGSLSDDGNVFDSGGPDGGAAVAHAALPMRRRPMRRGSMSAPTAQRSLEELCLAPAWKGRSLPRETFEDVLLRRHRACRMVFRKKSTPPDRFRSMHSAAESPPEGYVSTMYAKLLEEFPTTLETGAIRAAARALAAALDEGCARREHAVHYVDVSSEEGLEAVRKARRNGSFSASTSMAYLTRSAEDIGLTETTAKTMPLIRERRHAEALWRGLADGTLSCLTSGHSPCDLRFKDCAIESEFDLAFPGVSTMRHFLSAVWTGAASRGYGPADLCKWLCSEPARILGLHGRKGCIQPGADADVLVWDPEAAAVADDEHSTMLRWRGLAPTATQNMPSLVSGCYLKGVVDSVYVRGRIVVHNGGLVDTSLESRSGALIEQTRRPSFLVQPGAAAQEE